MDTTVNCFQIPVIEERQSINNAVQATLISYPNPSSSEFRLEMNNFNSLKKPILIVSDINGKSIDEIYPKTLRLSLNYTINGVINISLFDREKFISSVNHLFIE